MPIPTVITDLSTTAASNSPQGSESPTEGDNYLRAIQAIMRREHDDFGTASSAGVGAGLVGYATANTYAAGSVGEAIKSLRDNLATANTATLGANMVSWLPGITGGSQRTVQAKLREVISVTDRGCIGDGATANATANAAALNALATYVGTITDSEIAIEFPPGNYCVTSVDWTAMRQITIICRGAVFLTGVVSGTYILKFDATEPDPCNGIQMIGTLAIQNTASYTYGLYARFLTNSVINMSVSGAYSTAAVDIDACFDNDFQWLYAVNTTSNKHCIKCGSNNVNVNRFRIRCAGSNATSGQIGMELAGNGNSVFGDISNIQYGLKMTAAQGSFATIYFEGVGSPVTVSGTNRGNTISGGYCEVLDTKTGYDFSGGTVQGMNLVGLRLKGATGTTTGINLGTAAYGVNIIGPDFEAIDTEITGTWRGGSGGVNEQMVGGHRHYNNGVVGLYAGSADKIVTQTVSASPVAIDASAGDEQYLTFTTTGAVTINAPTNPTTGQSLWVNIRNNAGGALGTLTWDAVFKLNGGATGFTTPSNGNSRSIQFRYDGTNWVERVRGAADVPN